MTKIVSFYSFPPFYARSFFALHVPGEFFIIKWWKRIEGHYFIKWWKRIEDKMVETNRSIKWWKRIEGHYFRHQRSIKARKQILIKWWNSESRAGDDGTPGTCNINPYKSL